VGGELTPGPRPAAGSGCGRGLPLDAAARTCARGPGGTRAGLKRGGSRGRAPAEQGEQGRARRDGRR
ncbi:hypothetical protein, partial [Actinomadura sp. CNU-125]|uniref:hypothetical protein n=1 Tax=Actinomadura sp. CNU-125 TaxID=1904961 RepID=UPI0021CCAB53